MSIIGPFTSQDIINEAAELIGVVSPSGMVNNADAQSCLRTLNLMLSSWSADEVSARAYFTETFPILGGQREYQWGIGAPDFTTQRPDMVVTAGLQYINYGNLIVPMEVIGSNQYQSFGDRLIVTGPPNFAYVSYQMPYAIVDMYPIPDQGYNIIFTTIKDLAGMTSLNVPFSLDPIYYQPMVYNLAVAIAPKFGKKPNQMIINAALLGYQLLLKATSPDMFFSSDFPLSRTGLNAPILDGGYNS